MYMTFLFSTWILPNFANNVMVPPEATAHKLGIPVIEEGRAQRQDHTPLTNALIERK